MTEIEKNRNSNELFVGLVGPLGVPFDLIEKTIAEAMQTFGYKTVPIHLIDCVEKEISGLKTRVVTDPYDLACKSKIKKGNEFRKRVERKDAFSLLSCLKISIARGGRNLPDLPELCTNRVIYILRSLKTPEEITSLRKIYGRHFLLFGIYDSEKSRAKNLAERIKRSRAAGKTRDYLPTALDLINSDRDETQKNPFGQHLAESFSMADGFFNASSPERLREAIERFFDLLFGHPYITPSKEECGMFHAFAAGLRSCQLGRQVGAAIASRDGEIIAVGTNEVPKAFGGSYWTGDDPDGRDHVLGEDSNEQMKYQILQSLLTSLSTMKWFSKKRQRQKPAALTAIALQNPQIKETLLMEIIDYGRATHAEMSALLHASRIGVSVKGKNLFTTTFPCHNCAKHIVESGIFSVFYIEPYPKSMAVELHSDSIEVEGSGDRQVNFIPFVGVAPRLYAEAFHMRDIPRKKNGKIITFNKVGSTYRFHSLSAPYLIQEHEAVVELLNLFDDKGLDFRLNEQKKEYAPRVRKKKNQTN